MFLPTILSWPAWLLVVLLMAACGGRPEAVATQPQPVSSMAVVVAGSGSPTPDELGLVAGEVERALVRLQPSFPGLPERRFQVFVHHDREQLPVALAALLHEDSPGFALLGRRQVHIVMGEVWRTGSSLAGVVTHELVHELLDQWAGPHGMRVPRWFHEGLAQHLAGDTYLGASEEDLVWRLSARSLPSLQSLAEHFPKQREDLKAAYAISYSYVAWLARGYGVPALLAMVSAIDRDVTLEGALVGATHLTTLQLEDAWRAYLWNGSGAPWRVLFDNCFSLSLVGVLPLLALALMRRIRAEARVRERLADPSAPAPAAASDLHPYLADAVDAEFSLRNRRPAEGAGVGASPGPDDRPPPPEA